MNEEDKDRSPAMKPTFGALAPQRAMNPRLAKKHRSECRTPDDIYRREKRRPRRGDEESVIADSPEGTPSLAELARALSNDPNNLPVDLIYQFIHDNIDFIPNYGLHKGGLGALIDGCGNAFDQSDLMVLLLEAAGITTGVNYVMGTIKLSPSQWSNWLGIGQSDVTLASQLLANGGIANSVDGSNNLSLEHCWVQVNISGTNYAFDPAFKQYTATTGVNLETAMGYDRADFLSDANSGSTLTADYVQNINDANVQTNLQTYSMNLINWIKTNMPAASVDQILGGHSIVAVTGTVRQTALSYHDNTQTTTNASALPDNVKATIKIQYDLNTSTQLYNISSTFFTDDIYARRLTLWFDGSLIARLYLDGTQVGNASSAQSLGTTSNMVVTITHPYPTTFADAVQMASINAGGQTTIGTAWGVSSKQMAAVHQEGQNQAIADGLASGAEGLLGRSLLLVWDNFIGQGSRGVEMLSRMSNCTTVMHHFVGTICNQAYGSGIIKTVNSFLGAWSPSKLDTSADVASVGVAASLMFQMLESATQQQVTGVTSADPIQAMKTVNLAGTKIYDAKTSNWTTGTNVKSIMSTAGYTTAVLNTVENTLINANPSWRVAMPEDFTITMGSFTNFYAYMGIGGSGSSSGSSTIVGQTWFGSKGVVSGGYQDQPTTNAAAQDNARQSNGFGMPAVGANQSARVNMLNGRYEYSSTDLTVGNQGEPYSLSFTRSYNTALRLTFQGMGFGWSHNWQMNAKANSDGFIALGDEQVSGAAAAIVALYVTRDIALSNSALPINNVVISCIVQCFLNKQLINNVVRLKLGGGTAVFTLLPDGSYLPPAGMNRAAQLVLSSGQYILTTAEKVKFTFNTNGSINKIEYPFMPTANAIAFTYNGSGWLTQVSNGFRQLNFVYDGYGQLASVNDGNNHSVVFTIDYSTGNLTIVKDPLNNQTTYQYDQRGRLTKVFRPANPTSPVVENIYDSLHRVKQQKDAYNNIWNFYLAGHRSQETAPNNTSRWMFFNAKGNVVKATNALGQSVTTEYDGIGRAILATQPEGNSVSTTYDANGNVLTVTQTPKSGSGLSSRTTTMTYDSTWTSQVATVTDPQSRVTSKTYVGVGQNGAGKVTQVVQPAATIGGTQPTTTYTYNTYGQVLTTTDPTSVVTSNSYDSVTHDLLSATVDPSGLNIQTSFTYDAVGNLLTSTDPKGNVTTTAYNANRQPTQVTGPSPQNQAAYVTYDANGNVIQTRSLASADSNTQTSTTTYTIDDKVATVVGPVNIGEGSQSIPTRYEYDNLRRVSKVTDALGHAATSTFDAISRPLTGSVDGEVQQTLTYTTNGKVQSVKDGSNNTTQYTYDGFDRPIETAYPDSTLESVTYDNLDNVLTATTRAEITYGFTYDRLNRLTTKTPATGAVVSYTYDLSGRTLTVSTPQITGDPSTGTFTLSYDSAGRMYQEGFPDGKTVTATMDKNGNVTLLAYPGSGNNVTHTFDQLDRLISVSGFNASVAFAYDTASRRSSQVNGNGTGQGYSYDKVDNLMGMTIGGLEPNTTIGTPPRVDFGYMTNDAGQNQSKIASDATFVWQPNLAKTTSYGIANGLNQYPSVTGATFSYDDNGCLIDDGTNTYSYDFESRLILVTTPTGTIAYKYDPIGRLTLRTTGSVSTRYLYSGLQRIEEYDNTTGTLLRRYVYGQSLDESLYAVEALTGNVLYRHADEINSTILTTDSTGMPTQVIVYDPYGQLSAGSLTDIPIGYTGQFYESETGLYFYKARHYSPKIGRFLQPDPIGYKSSLNLYEYCNGDPINLRDPLGLTPLLKAKISLDVDSSSSNGFPDFASGLLGGITHIAKNVFETINLVKGIVSFFGGGSGGPSFSQRFSNFWSQLTAAQQQVGSSPGATGASMAPPVPPPSYLDRSVSWDSATARELGINLQAELEYASHLNTLDIAYHFWPGSTYDFKSRFPADSPLYKKAQNFGNRFYSRIMRQNGYSYPVAKVGAGAAQAVSMVGSWGKWVNDFVATGNTLRRTTSMGPLYDSNTNTWPLGDSPGDSLHVDVGWR